MTETFDWLPGDLVRCVNAEPSPPRPDRVIPPENRVPRAQLVAVVGRLTKGAIYEVEEMFVQPDASLGVRLVGVAADPFPGWRANRFETVRTLAGTSARRQADPETPQ